ncbi:MAG: ATP-dependent RecD-like DNA helicase [Legionellales bacterium]|nr:ATP-dependent RecD-like DNA helicase [Legionellales bacterium]OUX65189.1 MAG: hypothetical protein CBE41_01965 [Gammaproteobacteria bacterium TMED281]
MQIIHATVDRVIYYNEDNHYCVLRCKKKFENIDIVGNLINPKPGVELKVHGEWIVDPKFGKQFNSQFIEICLPKDNESIIKYLSSGRIKGIGPSIAKLIVDTFKEKTLNIINDDPNKLLKVDGIGKKKIKEITDSLKKDLVSQESLVFLQSLGISVKKSEKIFSFYGAECINIIKNNPYQLSYDLIGFGFLICDQIAISLGVKPDSSIRINAGIIYVLEEDSQFGHCWSKKNDLIQKVSKKINQPVEVIDQQLKTQIEQIYQWNHNGTEAVGLKNIISVEKDIAHLVSNRKKFKFQPNKAVITKTDLNPTQEQIDCVKKAMQLHTCVITGGPGVGKTTLVKLILQSLLSNGKRVLLCAPTGRAAKRLFESTGFESKTIHRLLEYDPITKGFKKNQHHPLSIDTLIVDESSMVDIHLFHSLIKSIPQHAQLLLVGDVDQLPSIGPGAVLQDLIFAYPTNVIRLTHVFRQAASSSIVSNAHNINNGKLPIKNDQSDCFIIDIQDNKKIQDTIVDLVANRIPSKFKFNPLQDIQVLTPTKKGLLGSYNLNKVLANQLNPNPVSIIDYNDQRFATGDKVIVQRNNYEKDVFNGDIGTIQFLENNTFTIDFNGKLVKYKHNELDELSLAYAITIHKSQGSEYPVVVMPISMSHFMMLNKNLIYTGLTRAKQLAVIITQKKAMIMSIKVNASPQRLTLLKDLLTDLKSTNFNFETT